MAKTVLALCALLWAPLALAATQVTEVAMRDGKVVIAADAPPNFTTFTMDNPPRLVVDLADAAFVNVPSDIAVGVGGIHGIQTLRYGSGASAVARIVITFDNPIQTDIATDGNNIVVQPAGGVAQTPPAQAAAMDDAMSALNKAPPPPAAAPAPAPTPPPTEQSAAAAPPPTPTPAPAPPPPHLAAPIPPSPRPAAAEPRVAVAPAAPPPARHEAEEPPAPPQQPASPPVVAQSSPPPSVIEEAFPAAPPTEQATPAPAPSTAPVPLKINTQASLASPPPPAATEEPVHVTGKRKTLSLVGLRFNNGSMSVFVRTNEPVSYRVSERPTGLTVTIENTRIARHNDTRALDAHFFDSPVANVRATQHRGDVEVNIELKNHAGYQATQTGREVQLNFSQG